MSTRRQLLPKIASSARNHGTNAWHPCDRAERRSVKSLRAFIADRRPGP